ncbi:MAG: hypothetical protein ACI4QN_06885 [Candidatus Coproplasma sp.]
MIGISFKLNGQQAELLDVRAKRELYKLCPESKLHSLISSAICESELTSIIKKYGIGDVCDFSGLHISVSKHLTDCIVTALYMYPKLRSRICFIGSKKGYEYALEKFIAYDDTFIKSLGVQYILSQASAKQIGQGVSKIINETSGRNGGNMLAQAINVGCVLDGIVLDDKDFEKNDIRQIKIELERSVLASHSPKDCASVKSVIFHEIGHLLDYLCRIAEDVQLCSLYNSMSVETIRTQLSYYATTSIHEFIAEGFAEYMSSQSPRSLARQVKQAIDRRYQCV